MGKNNNVIVINGKQYDALTGAPLSHGASKPSPTKAIKSAVKQPTMKDVVRTPAHHAQAHSPKAAHTLMRHAVKKPVPVAKKLVKRPLAEIEVKPSVNRLDAKRLQKASHIDQSKLIKHFSPITSDSNQTLATPVTATQAIPAAMAVPAKPAAKTKPKTTAEILEHAIQHATSHEQPAHHSRQAGKRKRRTTIAGAAALVVLLIGVITVQELPKLRLQLASNKAGFAARLPGYQPAGYSLGQLNYSPGVVATKFHSNSDNSRSYSITQKSSNWDSQSLKDLFVAPADSHYQTVQTGGRTIYLYGDGNATWVNGGVWYVIQSHGSLSNHQLVDLASSL